MNTAKNSYTISWIVENMRKYMADIIDNATYTPHEGYAPYISLNKAFFFKVISETEMWKDLI